MNALLEETIKQLGFPSIEEFAKFHALEILEHKVEIYKKEVEAFNQKYGMSFEDFSTRHSEIKDVDMLEKEDDHMDWEASLHSLHSLVKKVALLKQGVPINQSYDYREKIRNYFLSV